MSLEIMICGDLQQELLQLYLMHIESFRLEKTLNIIESNCRNAEPGESWRVTRLQKNLYINEPGGFGRAWVNMKGGDALGQRVQIGQAKFWKALELVVLLLFLVRFLMLGCHVHLKFSS